jgi:hypothetical protein
MFSLLTPFALWLAPLLAVPLAIALMGRTKSTTRDFPSLLPVQASLQHAMKRHRLKNWLQLILRTLVLLCLLLAAAGPIWRGRSTLTPPARAGVITQNGIYATIPLKSKAQSHGGNWATVGEQARGLREALDSMTAHTHGQLITEFIFPDHGDGGDTQSSGLPKRYGQPDEALARLVQNLEASGGADDRAAHVFVPVFAARDLAAIASSVQAWLQARPNARLIMIDHGEAASHLKAFGPVTADLGPDGLLNLSVPTIANRPPTWTPQSAAPGSATRTADSRTMRLEGSTAALTLPVSDRESDGRFIAGTIALAPGDPAYPKVAVPQHPVAIHVPPPSTLCHFGGREAFISLATLGEGGTRLKVVSLASAMAQPELNSSDPSGNTREGCNLLYLADPSDATAPLLTRAASILRTGGTVIVEAGRHTDAVLWNRNLLAPLDVGRFSEPVTTTPVAALAKREPLASLGPTGARADRWGKPGVVTTRFGFIPSANARVLMSTAPSGNGLTFPLLVEKQVGSGRLLVWTTSLSDPGWSTIGLGPWAVLFHQAILETSWAAGVRSVAIDTDSLTWLQSPSGMDLEPPRVLDPSGEPFVRRRAELGGWTLGPFDEPGLYRISNPGNGASATSVESWLAVSIADPPLPPTKADWQAFEEAIGPEAWSRTLRIEPDDDWRTLYGGTPLRLPLLMLAALLLFAEGAVSLRLAHVTRR